jgi:hypothetical protein
MPSRLHYTISPFTNLAFFLVALYSFSEAPRMFHKDAASTTDRVYPLIISSLFSRILSIMSSIHSLVASILATTDYLFNTSRKGMISLPCSVCLPICVPSHSQLHTHSAFDLSFRDLILSWTFIFHSRLWALALFFKSRTKLYYSIYHLYPLLHFPTSPPCRLLKRSASPRSTLPDSLLMA